MLGMLICVACRARSVIVCRASVLVWPSSFENLCFCLCFAVFVNFKLVFVVFVFVFAFETEILFPQKDERTRTDTLAQGFRLMASFSDSPSISGFGALEQ